MVIATEYQPLFRAFFPLSSTQRGTYFLHLIYLILVTFARRRTENVFTLLSPYLCWVEFHRVSLADGSYCNTCESFSPPHAAK